METLGPPEFIIFSNAFLLIFLLIFLSAVVLPLAIGYWCMVLFRNKGKSAGAGFALGAGCTFCFSLVGAVVAVVVSYTLEDESAKAVASQPVYGQPVYGQSPYGQPPQPPYAQSWPTPYAQTQQVPYGQPPQAPYAPPPQAPYGQPPYAPYVQPPYAWPQQAPPPQDSTAADCTPVSDGSTPGDGDVAAAPAPEAPSPPSLDE